MWKVIAEMIQVFDILALINSNSFSTKIYV